VLDGSAALRDPRADDPQLQPSHSVGRVRTLLPHRGLSHLFRADDIPDAGAAARVFRQLLALLPLEPRGLTDELVRQRRALRQLDETFFRYYMAVLGERRSFP
jgi:hypothetical protein